MPRSIQRDRRSSQKKRSTKATRPTVLPKGSAVCREVDARIEELRRRIAQGLPLFVDGERFSAGYGTFEAGTVADEGPRDVLNARKGPDGHQ